MWNNSRNLIRYYASRTPWPKRNPNAKPRSKTKIIAVSITSAAIVGSSAFIVNQSGQVLDGSSRKPLGKITKKREIFKGVSSYV